MWGEAPSGGWRDRGGFTGPKGVLGAARPDLPAQHFELSSVLQRAGTVPQFTYLHPYRGGEQDD